MPKLNKMASSDIALLKYIASTENISVEYYAGGKSYTIPVDSLVLDENYNLLTNFDEDASVYIDCSYTMILNIPYLYCEITYGSSNTPNETCCIPLETKRQTKRQREIMSLINTCSKRVIAQEMSRKKYAISAAVISLTENHQYN